jgi:cell shape-determining protein MreC
VLNVDRNVSGLFLKVEVMPAVRFSRLEEVFVVTPEKEKVQ